MNPISNIWKHPRTSVAGVLISVATVAGVLVQQGVTLGTVGGGTVVTLASALATALLGLLARDPGTAAQPAASCTGDCSNCSGNGGNSGATAKLSAWMLIALLPLPWMQGCNANSVAQDIVNWTPSLQSAIETVDSTAALLAPADAPAFTAATSGFDAASNLLVAQAQSYLANPGAGSLAKLQTQIVLLQQQVNSALLAAAHIVDSASQRHALAAIQAVATIITAILSLVQSVSSKAQVAQMAAQSTIKLAAVAPYLDGGQAARMVAVHYGEPVATARIQVARAERDEVAAGF
jgi:hypothetical protein